MVCDVLIGLPCMVAAACYRTVCAVRSQECIRMTDSKDPSYKPDWAKWAAVSRTELQAVTSWHAADSADFDTTISGPWMKQWPITHHNRHTAALKE